MSSRRRPQPENNKLHLALDVTSAILDNVTDGQFCNFVKDYPGLRDYCDIVIVVYTRVRSFLELPSETRDRIDRILNRLQQLIYISKLTVNQTPPSG